MEPAGLFADFYEITMAYGYWKSGTADREAVFHVYFRSHPFGGGFTLACGLADFAAWLDRPRFSADELRYLANLESAAGKPVFDAAFLEFLGGLGFACSIDALPEGTAVFPLEPLLRVRGPILQAQLLETAALNMLNFQSLIATKAARVCLAAGGDPVIEFGLRRAQGPDGGLSASRAAYVGGCAATSNTLAGKVFGIPVKGTMAHSWIMSFGDEAAAFAAFAEALPGNAFFLVDTYDTLKGVEHAIEAGRELKRRGRSLAGIRLDSGDLAWLSRESRRLLDAAGFYDALIMASNELDEHIIESLKAQGAAIDVWGVGTNLVTGAGQGALGGVYKLAAIRDAAGSWRPVAKISEQAEKTSVPGLLQVRRYGRNGLWLGDMILDETDPREPGDMIIDPFDSTRRKRLPAGASGRNLLVPVYERGRRVRANEDLSAIRKRAASELAHLDPGIRRFRNPHRYPAGLSADLHRKRLRLIAEAKGYPDAVSGGEFA